MTSTHNHDAHDPACYCGHGHAANEVVGAIAEVEKLLTECCARRLTPGEICDACGNVRNADAGAPMTFYAGQYVSLKDHASNVCAADTGIVLRTTDARMVEVEATEGPYAGAPFVLPISDLTPLR